MKKTKNPRSKTKKHVSKFSADKKHFYIFAVMIIFLLVAGTFGFKKLFPYLGWETAYLKNEKLTVRYPANWQAEVLDENAGTECAYDYIDLRNSQTGKVSVSIQTSSGIPIPSDPIIETEEISVLGQERILALTEYLDPEFKADPNSTNMVGNAYLVEKEVTELNEHERIDAVNTPDCYQTGSANMVVDLMYIPSEEQGSSEVDVETFKNDPNYQTIKKILQSMKYEN